MKNMLSVVIPCVEDKALLSCTLRSIFLSVPPSRDFEILVVSNSKVNIKKSEQIPIREIVGEFKTPSAALNVGIEHTKGNIICATKPGCIVAGDWLKKIEDFFASHSFADGVGGPVLPCFDTGNSLQKIASQIFHEDQVFSQSEIQLKSENFASLFHATNMAFRKSAIDHSKFDESLYYDYDFDVCLRLVNEGHCLVFSPVIKVNYVFPENLGKILKRYYIWGLEYMLLRKRYQKRVGFLVIIFPWINMIRVFLSSRQLFSRKNTLRLVQNLAWNIGYVIGNAEVTQS